MSAHIYIFISQHNLRFIWAYDVKYRLTEHLKNSKEPLMPENLYMVVN